MTVDEVRALLREEIKKAGTAKAWSDQHQISPTVVSDIVNGLRNPSAKVMGALGLHRETIYCRKGDE